MTPAANSSCRRPFTSSWRPPSGRLAYRLTLGLVILGWTGLVGCSCRDAPPRNSDPEVGARSAQSAVLAPAAEEERLASSADTTSTQLTSVLPAYGPLPPEGSLDIRELETIYRDVLDLVAASEYGQAQDLIFLLQDQVLSSLPAETDTLYLAHRRSLERRLVLVSGLIAEGCAYRESPVVADSVIAAHYAELTSRSFPDSLVPFNGDHRPPLVADLLLVDNALVRKWIDYFTGSGRRHFSYWLRRKTAADSLMSAVLTEEGLPRELIYLAMIESGLSPHARSNVGAVGPWQFMAGTAKLFDLRHDWWVDERRDLEMSTRAACNYLKRLYAQFGDWALVLAAYNSGENRIVRSMRLSGHDNYWRLRLPSQTADFVPKFIAAARIGENPQLYGFDVSPLPPLTYEVVEVNDATDLDLIARCAGVPASQVVELNPALLRRASPPDSPHYPVRIPSGSAALCRTELRKVPPDQRLTWRRHKVERGETLSQIALRYGTSARDIAKLNNLRSVHLIRPGDQLLIPMPATLAAKAKQRAEEKGHYVPPDGYQRVSYNVKKGDTLSGIARKLGVSLNHLRRVNGLYKTSLIKPGQKLYAYRPAVGEGSG